MEECGCEETPDRVLADADPVPRREPANERGGHGRKQYRGNEEAGVHLP